MAQNKRAIVLNRVTLAQLDVNTDNIIVIAIIIAKNRPRKFEGRNGKETPRAVWNFTIRDSPRDYINCNYWGPSDEVFSTAERFHIADVVEITKPVIFVRRINENGENYRPMVTSPFILNLVEHSKIALHLQNTLTYTSLLHLPTKPIAGYVTLRDIHNSGGSMKGTWVDILVAVRSVTPIRNVSIKTGEEVHLREVLVFDHTSPCMRLTVWEGDILMRAGNWKPRFTILFITDVKVDWSDFQRAYSVSLTSRSIVTEDPKAIEATNLAKYAKNAPLELVAIANQMVNHFPDPNTIQNVMSVQQVHHKANMFLEQNPGDQQFTALLYVMVTHLDLDGLSPSTRTTCALCLSWVNNNGPPSCDNPNCGVYQGNEAPAFDVSFDIRVNLTDHTGTLANCRLTGKAAETVLGCSVSEFMAMSDEQKSDLKWKYLLERCTVRIIAVLFSRRKPVMSIVSCSVSNMMEVEQRLPLF